MIRKLITLLRRSRRHETNATGTNWNGFKINKLRLFNDWWQTRKYLVFFLGLSYEHIHLPYEHSHAKNLVAAHDGEERGLSWGLLAGGGSQRRSRSSPKRQQRWLLVMAGRSEQAVEAVVVHAREQGRGTGRRRATGQGWRRGNGAGTRDGAVVAPGSRRRRRRPRPWWSSPENVNGKGKPKGNDQTVMDGCKEGHADVEDDEI